MSDVAIRVKGLGKRYRVDQVNVTNNRRRYLADALLNVACEPLRRVSSFARQPSANGHRRRVMGNKHIWALKDLDFEVNYGEIVGIIGRNGAGKSTLLKILTGVTEPTEGYGEIYGRVGSLLEVGTGFHPELTGRENTYLNGAILGMKRAEIDHNFDEIVAFAEIEEFIDTPVKRYSSGMYMRLAFAVAAHLESEILLVDEVLAVGDAAFQKKCLGKMGDVVREGRTVVFVSHNMAAIESICNCCLLLREGRVVSAGDTRQLIGQYLTSNEDHNSGLKALSSHSGRAKGSIPTMTEVALFGDLAEPISSLRMGSSLSVQVHFHSSSMAVCPVLAVSFKSADCMPIFTVNNKFIENNLSSEPITHGVITCHFERLPLMPGTYFLDLYFGDQQREFDVIHEAISLEVVAADVFGTSKLPSASGGPIYWHANWTLKNGQADV
jgi:lipopolysaccharide transport system ATP-binding protein